MTAHLTPRRRTILLFTWAAGCVDAIVYIAAHVFTANMTGNAVLLGISVGKALSIATVRSLVALVTFTLGVIAGAILVAGEGHGIPWKGVRIAVVVETVVLALFVTTFFLPIRLESEFAIEMLIVFSGFAMGMQSATVKRLNLPGIATTYITGTMTSLISGLVHQWGMEEEDQDEEQDVAKERSLALQAWVFTLYVAAAIASAVLYKRWPSGVALLPFIAIVLVTVSLYKQHPPKAKLHL